MISGKTCKLLLGFTFMQPLQWKRKLHIQFSERIVKLIGKVIKFIEVTIYRTVIRMNNWNLPSFPKKVLEEMRRTRRHAWMIRERCSRVSLFASSICIKSQNQTQTFSETITNKNFYIIKTIRHSTQSRFV